MKKIVNNAVSKILMLLSFTFVSVQSWAYNGEPGGSPDYGKVVTSPEFIVGVILFIGFLTAGLLVGRKRKNA